MDIVDSVNTLDTRDNGVTVDIVDTGVILVIVVFLVSVETWFNVDIVNIWVTVDCGSCCRWGYRLCPS